MKFVLSSVLLLFLATASSPTASAASQAPRAAAPRVNALKPAAESAPATKATAKTETTSKPADFGERIERNPQLASRVHAMLPPGVDLKTAAEGFKDEGQFLAALHASKNLNISFGLIRSKIIAHKNLGQAIHELQSETNAKAAARAAENEAAADIKTSRTLRTAPSGQ
jgi:hypothetical protein